MISRTVGELADILRGKVEGCENTLITGVAGIREAKPGHVTFLASQKYLPFLEQTEASAILMDSSLDCQSSKTLIRVSNASSAFNKVVSLFSEGLDSFVPGISEKAHIGQRVKLGNNITIQPFAVIDDDAEIGSNTVIQAGVYVGRKATLGENCRVYPNVSILDRVKIGSRVIIHSGTVIGSDGFGFEPGPGGIPQKVLQVGTVIVEDDVEIGSNVSIDRARSDKTWIRRGTKIDNLVHVAHNVEVGEGTMLLAQCGIAGSSILGRGVIVAGQAGINGHIRLGDGVTATSKAGVTKDTPSGKMVSGFPACEHNKFRKVTVSLTHVPDLIKQVVNLEKRIAELEKTSQKSIG